ncbi:hypothetical protein L9F63_006949, partial [Diploptera punctata]
CCLFVAVFGGVHFPLNPGPLKFVCANHHLRLRKDVCTSCSLMAHPHQLPLQTATFAVHYQSLEIQIPSTVRYICLLIGQRTVNLLIDEFCKKKIENNL